ATVAAVGVRGSGVLRSGARAAAGGVGGRVSAVGLAAIGNAQGIAAVGVARRRIRAVVAGVAAVGVLLRQVDRDRVVLPGVGRAGVTACRDAALADVRLLRGDLRLHGQHHVADAQRLVVAVLCAGITDVCVGGVVAAAGDAFIAARLEVTRHCRRSDNREDNNGGNETSKPP